MATKPQVRLSPERVEIESLIEEFGEKRALKILQARQNQLIRQRTAEYRAQQAKRAHETREADKRYIAELEAKLARRERGEPEPEEEADFEEPSHAA